MPEESKTILLVDHNSPTLISLVEHLGAESTDARILIARSPAATLDLARLNQPDVAIVLSSFVEVGKQSLTDLIKEVSPETRIIVANSAAAGQG